MITENHWAKWFYNHSPLLVQNLAVSLEGWRQRRQWYGGNFEQLLTAALERESWSSDQIREYQLQRLLAFVRHAASTVPFYQRKFGEIGVEAGDIKSFDDYARLPVLTKDEVQENLLTLRSTDRTLGRLLPAATSGTTGTALNFFTTLQAFRERWAVRWRYRFRHGLKRDFWSGRWVKTIVAPRGRRKNTYWRVNYPERLVCFSLNHLSEQTTPFYIEEISRRGLPWLHGYPSTLVLLADVMLTTGRELPSVRWITTDSELLLDTQRKSIEEAFKLTVRQNYGLLEAVANFTECPQGNLHVDEDYAYAEFIPSPYGEGVMNIIGTNLSNLAFPLLRYDTGDSARLSEEKCPCGLPGRVVKVIEGRNNDYILTPKGEKMACMHEIVNESPHVRAAQLVQRQIDLVELLIVRRDGFHPKEAKSILNNLRGRLGRGMTIRVRYVENIQRTGSGKMKFVVSELERGKIGSGDSTFQSERNS